MFEDAAYRAEHWREIEGLLGPWCRARRRDEIIERAQELRLRVGPRPGHRRAGRPRARGTSRVGTAGPRRPRRGRAARAPVPAAVVRAPDGGRAPTRRALGGDTERRRADRSPEARATRRAPAPDSSAGQLASLRRPRPRFSRTSGRAGVTGSSAATSCRAAPVSPRTTRSTTRFTRSASSSRSPSASTSDFRARCGRPRCNDRSTSTRCC